MVQFGITKTAQQLQIFKKKKSVQVTATQAYYDKTRQKAGGCFEHTPHQNSQHLNIMLITETWLPDINGVASSMFHIMQQIKNMGHRISLVRPKHSDTVEKASRIEGKNFQAVHHDMQVPSLPIPHYPHLRMGIPHYPMLLNLFKEERPDIVHIVTEGPLGLAALMAAKRAGIKVSSGYHTPFHDFSRYFGWRMIAMSILGCMKRFHNACHATCVPSATTFKGLHALGFNNLFEVGRGVDSELFGPGKRDSKLRECWHANDETTVLMYVGRVSPEKGIDTVIKGYQALKIKQLQRDVRLVIVGDGPELTKLKQHHQDDDGVIYAGFQTGEDLARHYASGDAFIFASQVETFGNVVTEAMASGLPVFAYHDAAAALLVDETCGSTVKLGDETGFIDMIQSLPKQQQLNKMRSVATAKVADFTWQRPAKQMLAMFKSVLDEDKLANPPVSSQAINEPKTSRISTFIKPS